MDIIRNIIASTGPIERVHTENLASAEGFTDLAARFADLPGTVVLLSGGGHDAARYHILATAPWLAVKSHGGEVVFEAGDQVWRENGDPLDMVQGLVNGFGFRDPALFGPVAAGLFGYFAYDLKDFVETLPKTTIDDLGLPQLCLYAPSAIVVHDRQTGENRLHVPVRKPGGGASAAATGDAAWQAFYDRLAAKRGSAKSFSGNSAGFSARFDRRSYMAAVERVKDYIRAGDIYQVNLSQRFETDFYGSSFAMFQTLFETAPAPFYAYVHAGDHRIVSTSPERFVRRAGTEVETRPIKGTRPRGKTAAEDRANADALQASGKDDAELSMIVDLMRNDLGRVCRGGSVKVTAHKRLEAYENVFHLVSIVEGRLQAGKDSVDLIRAAFPGGSITGCPRIRAMEIIDELEPCRRHIYTGSIGYIGFDDTADLSIAIRTATIAGNRMVFSVGGGVVFDSDPAEEYEETIDKGRSVMGVFKNRAASAPEVRFAWFNGRIVPLSDVCLPVTDEGIQYGFGFFETIRAENGSPCWLDDHLERFCSTWQTLFETTPPDLSWQAIMAAVISANGLESSTAAVKLMATRGTGDAHRGGPSLVVTARPYVHRLSQLRKSGLSLAAYPHARQSPLADHKTLNYLYYLLAGKWAKARGADEALITNADGSISETNTGNLLMVRGHTVIRPVSPHVLSGVMEKKVTQYLADSGFEISHRRVVPGEIPDFDTVMVTNSLMGAVAVIDITGTKLSPQQGLCRQINAAVL
ncbi:MAG: aminodeoxychorismate synthase component I [Thermodesulfobacteriota bacterium]